jgi:hypothetical protein
MPIKKQDNRTHRKIQKKTANNKVILFIIAIVFIVIVIFGYILFRGPSETIIKDGFSEKTGQPENNNKQAGSIIAEEFQAAVARAKLQLEAVDNKDILKVIIEKTVGADSREINYKYEWSINGQLAGSGNDNISGFKRGDKIAVKITPFDGERPGKPRTLSVEVQNATPKVSEGKEPMYDGKTFTMQINAIDPDGDALSYDLLSGPEGMTIDKKSGTVNWPVKDDSSGDYPVKVKISDGHGGETTYQLTVTIPKGSPLTATTPKKTP